MVRRAGRPRKVEVVVRTEGQRQLVARPEGVSELARIVGVDEQRIDDWRSGRRKPAPQNARRLASTLDIPTTAWARAPSTAPPVDAPSSPPPPSAPSSLTSLEEIEEMLAALRNEPDDLLEKERAKRLEQRARLLALKSKIEYQERLTEDAIVRAHPRWAEIRTALREALEPYPSALAAVHARLSAIGAWEDARGELERAAEEEVSA